MVKIVYVIVCTGITRIMKLDFITFNDWCQISVKMLQYITFTFKKHNRSSLALYKNAIVILHKPWNCFESLVVQYPLGIMYTGLILFSSSFSCCNGNTHYSVYLVTDNFISLNWRSTTWKQCIKCIILFW